MLNLIKQAALEAVSSMNPMEIVEAEVTSPLPDIKITFKDNPKLVIPSDLILVSEHLTNHTRDMRLDEDSEVQTYEFVDELKTGDQVMVASIQGGQSFFILDRYVKGG